MTTKVGILVLAALVIVLGGCEEEGGGAGPALRSGWPVPGPDSQARFELSLVTQGPVGIAGGTLHGARLRSWVTVHVETGDDPKVRPTLERLVAEGDAWTRYEAARARRCLVGP